MPKRQRGPRVKDGEKMPETTKDLNLKIEDGMLKVLLNTSDSYRLFKTTQEPDSDEKMLVHFPN